MTTFALVHGAWHGAWCWEKLIPELEAQGHRTIAMDLPSEDPDATFETYADVVVDAVGDADDLVLVGHSLAGYTIPLAGARLPVRALVYLNALIPMPGRSMAEQFEAEPDTLFPDYEAGVTEPDERSRRHWVDAEIARQVFYADCAEEDAAAAFARLRPQATAGQVVPLPLEEFPSAPATYVLGTEDKIVNPDWSRRTAPERLGAEVVELQTSHSPFVSRPAEVASLLTSLA